MKVRLVKRNKITHCGFVARVWGEIATYSICNKRWDCNDKTSMGEESEVTCKRCLKILAKTDDDGCVIL